MVDPFMVFHPSNDTCISEDRCYCIQVTGPISFVGHICSLSQPWSLVLKQMKSWELIYKVGSQLFYFLSPNYNSFLICRRAFFSRRDTCA